MSMINSLKKFFGINKKRIPARRPTPKQPVGNRALPREMQVEVLMAAMDKRERKERAHICTHLTQLRQGYHNFG